MKLFSRALGFGQGFYFVITGLWPSVAPDSFRAITGTEGPAWAFIAIGVLITAIGFCLLAAAFREDDSASIKLLGALSATALIIVDVKLISLRVIGRLNNLDVGLQAAFVAAWISTLRRSKG